MNHYVYKITDLSCQRYYIGVRSCEGPPGGDLGFKYFSSSSNQDFIRRQKTRQNDFDYEIIRTFDNRESALLLEETIHEELDVSCNDSFINLAKQKGIKFDRTGTKYKPIVELGTGKVRHIGHEDSIPDGYIYGSKIYCSITKKKRIKSWTDGCGNITLDPFIDEIPEGFTPGFTRNWSNTASRTIANDGIREYWVYPCEIPDGLTIGRLKTGSMASVTGKKIYNNGRVNKYFSSSPPSGWIKGRTEDSKNYGRKKTEEELRKISENHADFSGSKHPRAKKYLLTSPDGKTYYCHGNLTKTCKDLDINQGLLRKYMPIVVVKNKKNNKTIGWKLEELK